MSEAKILSDTYKLMQSKLIGHRLSNTPLNPVNVTTKRKIAPQRRLFSVKNKKIKRSNVVSNPTTQESENIALSLVMSRIDADGSPKASSYY